MAKGPVAQGLGRAEALSDAGEYAAALEELDGRRRRPSRTTPPCSRPAAGRSRTSVPSGSARRASAYEAALTLDPVGDVGEGGARRTCCGAWADGREADRLCERGRSRKGVSRYEAEEDLLGARRMVRAAARPLRRRGGDAPRGPRAATAAGSRSASTSPWRCSARASGRAPSSSTRAGVHQAVNGGVERLRGAVRVALDDLEESLSERPALATTREAIAARDLLRVHAAGRLPSRLSGWATTGTVARSSIGGCGSSRRCAIATSGCSGRGMTVSLLGDGIIYVALAWQAYELSNAPTALSDDRRRDDDPARRAPARRRGVVSDRFDRRKVMIAADLMRAVAVGALGALALSGRLQLWHMFVLIAACSAPGRRSSVRRSTRSSPSSSRMPS